MKSSSLLIMITLSNLTNAAEIANGDRTSYSSPNSVEENCLIVDEMPSGKYSKKDSNKAQSFCSVDFYNDPNIGLCAKTWSTSPATVIYNLVGTSYENRKAKFEDDICGTSSTRKFKTLAKFKNSMNQEGTSGTYSVSNLVYFHLSRFFDVGIDVPVSVYREIDKEQHLKIAKSGASDSPRGMIRNGWKWTIKAIKRPSKYNPTNDLFTNDLEKIYGVMVKGGGERYGAEINGIRSSWGQPAAEDFLNTPAFVALANSNSLELAISETLENYQDLIASEKTNKRGKSGAIENLNYLSSVLPKISKEQVAFWMQDLTEIVILDTILNQQDRIGNIDYKWHAVALSDDGKITSEKLDSEDSLLKINSLSTTLTGSKVKFIQRTYLNDNDAGVRNAYVNFTKKVNAVSKISHISVELYTKVKDLRDDLNSKGEIFDYIKSNFGLKSSEIESIVTNTNFVFDELKSNCISQKLKFDLYPKEFFAKNKVMQRIANCE